MCYQVKLDCALFTVCVVPGEVGLCIVHSVCVLPGEIGLCVVHCVLPGDI